MDVSDETSAFSDGQPLMFFSLFISSFLSENFTSEIYSPKLHSMIMTDLLLLSCFSSIQI